MKPFLLIIILLTSWGIEAKEIFPQGCVAYAVHGDYIQLTTKKPVVIMLHNLSDTNVWITHPVKNPSAQAGWSSQLNPGKWSAFALSQHKKKFTLSCIESRPGHEQQIACTDVLAVCKWPQSQFPEDKSGTFWAAENMDLLPSQAYLERMGFRLTE